jgi:hypothetical protein
MALTLNTTIHFISGKTLDVVETIAQVWAAAPTTLVYPAAAVTISNAVTLTVADGTHVSVALNRVEWMAPK